MNLRPLARLLVRRPRTVILVFTLITIVFGFQATNLYMESDFSNYLSKDDPTLALWKEISNEFQTGSTIMIIIDQTDQAFDIRESRVLN